MADKKMIYLDNSATTPMSRAAIEAYVRAATAQFGNPSSLHRLGVEAERVIDEARENILSSLYTKDGTVIFTGSGSEANNLAITGRAHARSRFKHAKIITTEGEHASVNRAMDALEKEGLRIVYIPTVGGEVDIEALRRALDEDTVLVSCMLVNNETGAVYNIPEIARATRELSPEAYLHVDATQGYLKIPFSPEGLGADMITISAHKVHGPKGVGALYVARRVIKEGGISAIIHGGGQERGLRSGTENVQGIAAFGAAAKEGKEKIKETREACEALRARLIDMIKSDEVLCEISITEPKMHAPHILNITLPNIKSETMLHFLSAEGIFVSSGSACSSNHPGTSRALTAYGRSEREADCSIRISLSAESTEEHISALADALKHGLSRLARTKK